MRKRHSQRLIYFDALLDSTLPRDLLDVFSTGCDLYTLVKLHQFCNNRKSIVIVILVPKDAQKPSLSGFTEMP